MSKVYHKIIKPILFRFDPEFMHDTFTILGQILGSNPVTRWCTALFCNYEHKSLNIVVDGIKYKNPVGLGAGFDKNAKLTKIMPSVGFGFEEIGSVTAKPCKGNPKPRIWRVIEHNSLIVNYGLANEGALKISKRIHKKVKIPIGISIAKTNDPTIQGKYSVDDYYDSYKLLHNLGDYITINISCPNVGDGRCFEEPDLLEDLLKKIGKHKKPIYLKLSPEISEKNLDGIIKLAEKYKIQGFVVSNLTHNRELVGNYDKKGNISGKPVKELSTKLIRKIYNKTKGKFVIIGVGGIFTAEDAYEKIKAGASLIQIITSLIYEGPTVVKRINKGLVKLLEKDGYKSIKDAVGKANQPSLNKFL